MTAFAATNARPIGRATDLVSKGIHVGVRIQLQPDLFAFWSIHIQHIAQVEPQGEKIDLWRLPRMSVSLPNIISTPS